MSGYPLVAFIAVRKEANKVAVAEPRHHHFSCEITFAFPCESRLPKALQAIVLPVWLSPIR